MKIKSVYFFLINIAFALLSMRPTLCMNEQAAQLEMDDEELLLVTTDRKTSFKNAWSMQTSGQIPTDATDILGKDKCQLLIGLFAHEHPEAISALTEHFQRANKVVRDSALINKKDANFQSAAEAILTSHTALLAQHWLAPDAHEAFKKLIPQRLINESRQVAIDLENQLTHLSRGLLQRISAADVQALLQSITYAHKRQLAHFLNLELMFLKQYHSQIESTQLRKLRSAFFTKLLYFVVASSVIFLALVKVTFPDLHLVAAAGISTAMGSILAAFLVILWYDELKRKPALLTLLNRQITLLEQVLQKASDAIPVIEDPA